MSKSEQELQLVNKRILECSICNKSKQGQLVVGEGSATAKVVFIGEAPGKEEIKTGRPFVGRSGTLLREWIKNTDLTEKDTFITSSIKYLPKNYITPKPKDIEHGRIHLLQQLKVIKPKVVVLLGNSATVSQLNTKLSISKAHGTVVVIDGLKYFISYHPAAALYLPKLRQIIAKDFKKLKRIINE